ncbi:hypothetical protein TVAG_317680 [Trichomonas vaginalis G3]|uniref:Uncharacterized protein n=1 Tax=Trichomonas vaginalis (strain ATCC PRA-98 / G3) TaxID=412133 RepID=A2F3L5_TRIV3|nr:hypothetical protein TVAGG3_0551730 [Trichomonas vaginalis G3]EAY00483.1 hypothetical protein TVAG_317680 [Trichomonas vaginalis G3]KAI5520558.1 hypothetical protein TVAGG3_0551730 [Trichomonas vaginalis G3]|eukprot:XP_001313412.1 hypothetical protein [Trichomonas vaginalis G3]
MKAVKIEIQSGTTNISFYKDLLTNKTKMKHCICHGMKKIYSFGKNSIEIQVLKSEMNKYALSAKNIKYIDDTEDIYVALDVNNDWNLNSKQIDLCLMTKKNYPQIGKKNENRLPVYSMDITAGRNMNGPSYNPNSFGSNIRGMNEEYMFMISDLPIQVQEHFKNEIADEIKKSLKIDQISYQNGNWIVDKSLETTIKDAFRINRLRIPDLSRLYMSLDQFNISHHDIKMKLFDHVKIEGNFVFIDNEDQKFMSDEDMRAFLEDERLVNQNTQFFQYKLIDLNENIMTKKYDAFKMRRILEEMYDNKNMKDLPKKLTEMGINVSILGFFYWMFSCDETKYVAEKILKDLPK